MIFVVLVELPDALPSCLGSWEDLLFYANRLSLRRGTGEIFNVSRWGPGTALPRPVHVALVPARILAGAEGTVVPPSSPSVQAVLRQWANGGVLMGAVCAGVFVLAEAGLLVGRQATTHWSLAEEFRRRFPRVKLEPDALVIDDGDRLIGGGMTAYFDVGLRVILRFGGVGLARECAAVFVLDPARQHQSPFAPAGLGTTDNDSVLAKALNWAHEKTVLDFTVEGWAKAVAIEKRTFERRALAAWGFGPAERLRRLRLDRARMLISTAGLSWGEVSLRCGYQDPSAFRRLFLERFGQTPGEYRRRFA